MYNRKYFIGLFIFLSLYVYPLFADVPGYIQLTQSVGEDAVQRVLEEHRLEVEDKLKSSDLIQLVKEEDRKQFSNDVIQKLYDYQMEIKENAYQNTMKLCPAYRIAKGKGLPEYHKRLSDSYYVQHESAEVRGWALNMNDEYGENLSSSLQEWLYVMYEGAAQPFSAIGGVKADWLQQKSEISVFEMESWFYSFYTLYLTDSLGFVQAAIHCLGTMDADEINQFASTVLAVDTGISVSGYAVTFWTGDKILRLIIHGLRWSSRPLGRAIVALSNRYNIPMSTVKKYAVVAGLVGLGGLGVWATDAVLESREEQELFQEIMQLEIERAKNKRLQQSE